MQPLKDELHAEYPQPAADLLGTVLHSHPDFFPIIQNIREKYGIPEFSSDADGLEEILLKRLGH